MRFEPRRSPEDLVRELRGGTLPPSRAEARVEALLERLRRAAGESATGASERETDAAEAELGLPLPPAYRRFLLLAGGATKAPAWRGLWRIDELVSLN
ncbi:MAG: SMI1/KNR4 family protein, partial [Planctomycetota bacterium]